MNFHPTSYNLDDPAEVKRLLRECEGYLHTCRRDHHGTDLQGRQFAMVALRALAEGYVGDDCSCVMCLAEGENSPHRRRIPAPVSPSTPRQDAPSDTDLSAWARNWHWND